MAIVKIRVTGDETHSNALVTLLHGLDGIEHVEEIADLMPDEDDDDSSSAGLVDDIGPGIHEIEIEAPNALVAERVRDVAADAAEGLGITVEFVDEF